MSKFSFSASSSWTGRDGFLGSLDAGRTAAPAPARLGVDFVFLPSADEGAGGPWPWHSKKHKQWRNSNREGSPLAFWRKVKDALRYLTFARRRGSYIAPGPHGRRNNIVRDPLPHGAGSPPPASGGGIARLPPRQARLEVPGLPPFGLPDLSNQLPMSVHSLAIPPTIFRGLPVTPEKPIHYNEEILFIADTDRFVNRAAAQRVLHDLLALMQAHSTVQVEIVGNAADDVADQQFGFTRVYGSNERLLRKFPMWGYDKAGAHYGTEFRTLGDLMLARARAIGNLLISRGISPDRVHCSIGRLGYGTAGVPSNATRQRAARMRRATIIISE